MSLENKYYIVSKTGFGGPGFRLAEKLVRKGKDLVKNPRIPSRGPQGEIITTKKRTSSQGELWRVSARPNLSPSSPKARVALLSLTEPIEPSRLWSPTDYSPVEFALIVLNRLISEKEIKLSPAEKLFLILQSESRFPMQNPDVLKQRISQRYQEGNSLRIGLFVCLNMKCQAIENRPVNYVGQEQNRLETPRIKRRTQELTARLADSGLPFQWDFILADTDPEEIYGDWLSGDQSQAIDLYESRLRTQVRWSSLKSKYQEEYSSNFDLALANCEQLVGPDYIQASVQRRQNFFTDKVGLPITAENRLVCELTARRNIASYAAQGPIINREYDCLIIADQDPLRFGVIQSLFAPELPIWYPYPG
ncbi:MAG: hypothetical protein UX80_C0003G0066 [Candidatus Amesbacteria bacterium GW2011_GWA2_47_11b]|uniref:Uncharacterized protein n=1 Tax=Candidatus Amesbacteria bacterium GW2011_GWA2_47_11b TaxID=1618358 RepID=A0A0G1RMN7_9BACT|nr:MAG: hypothetical protein UX80_C0003G0066 [Candidatus Amesbacteria bacterium GW2011_GWA2_47_11b]